jgi:hypothetical protein
MSGDIYTFSIYHNYRVLNLINEVSEVINENEDLIDVLRREDGEFNITEKDVFINDGDYFHIFIRQPANLYFNYDEDNNIFVLKKEDKIITSYELNDEDEYDIRDIRDIRDICDICDIPNIFNLFIKLSVYSVNLLRGYIMAKLREEDEYDICGDIHMILEESNKDIVLIFFRDFVRLNPINTYIELEYE